MAKPGIRSFRQWIREEIFRKPKVRYQVVMYLPDADYAMHYEIYLTPIEAFGAFDYHLFPTYLKVVMFIDGKPMWEIPRNG